VSFGIFSAALSRLRQFNAHQAMEDQTCDTTRSTATANRSVNKASFIASLVNRSTHNNAAFRTGYELCPGERAVERRAGDFARYGHLEMLRIRLAQLMAAALYATISKK
jgi:hypothetical protein